MALDDLEGMDIPDNKGGRPSKEEQEEKGEYEQYGVAFRYGDDLTEVWMHETINDCLPDGLPSKEDRDEFKLALMDIADYTNSSEVVVRRALDELDIVDVDWYEYLSRHPHLLSSPEIPDEWYRANKGKSTSHKETIKILQGERDPAYTLVTKPGEAGSTSSSTGFLSDLGEEEDGEDEPSSGLKSIIEGTKSGN